ncbi:MAG: P-type conjugative transfer protein TrbJ [Sphingomonas sp.]|jgi:P-type conjugative transfer protein TrbJ|uniref:P-type conjugative transfer protein TrbJ n=1 Tax=Sphingomonas sp. TaxID=28214 RepID=UPI0035661F51
MKRPLIWCAGLVLAALPVPSTAQFGGVVFDPSNYAQNVLTAARALEQIDNQIQSLQNQATSLINQARNLASLPLSTAATLQAQLQRTQILLGSAQRIAMTQAAVDQAFTARYRSVDLSASDQALVDNARERWRDTVGAFEDALKVQAGVVGNIDGARATMDALVGASQSATGALQAAQAGNQLLALQAQQLADLTALMASASRAQTLDAAERAAARDQAREQLRRFLTPGPRYQPGTARMFH